MTPLCHPGNFQRDSPADESFPNPCTCERRPSPTRPKAPLNPQGSSTTDGCSARSPCSMSRSQPPASFIARHFPNFRLHPNLQDFIPPLSQPGSPFLVFSVYLTLLHSRGTPQPPSAPGTLPRCTPLVKSPSQTVALGPGWMSDSPAEA